MPTTKKYDHWNRPSIDFCMNCLRHRIGRNVGYCWFCTKCDLHQLNYMHGMRLKKGNTVAISYIVLHVVDYGLHMTKELNVLACK